MCTCLLAQYSVYTQEKSVCVPSNNKHDDTCNCVHCTPGDSIVVLWLYSVENKVSCGCVSYFVNNYAPVTVKHIVSG